MGPLRKPVSNNPPAQPPFQFVTVFVFCGMGEKPGTPHQTTWETGPHHLIQTNLRLSWSAAQLSAAQAESQLPQSSYRANPPQKGKSNFSIDPSICRICV
jgi:hypothetical protein